MRSDCKANTFQSLYCSLSIYLSLCLSLTLFYFSFVSKTTRAHNSKLLFLIFFFFWIDFQCLFFLISFFSVHICFSIFICLSTLISFFFFLALHITGKQFKEKLNLFSVKYIFFSFFYKLAELLCLLKNIYYFLCWMLFVFSNGS